MRSPGTFEDTCTFNVWLRPDRGGTFSVKFSVSEGRGVLRVSSPGVQVDPPTRTNDVITNLTWADLHAARFLLTPRRGQRRTYHFSDLDAGHIEDIQADAWNSLEPDIINGRRTFLPPTFDDDDTSLILTIPLEAMTPEPSDAAHLRGEVHRLTSELSEERKRTEEMEVRVARLDEQLQKIRRQMVGDEFL